MASGGELDGNWSSCYGLKLRNRLDSVRSVEVRVRTPETILGVVVFHKRVHLIGVDILTEFLVPDVARGEESLILQLARPQLAQQPRTFDSILLGNFSPVIRSLQLLESLRRRVNDV